jgi:pyruvate dehydrogenase E1 component alpha subunit
MTPTEVERWRAAVEAEVEAEIAAAVEAADAAPLEPVEDLLRHVTEAMKDVVAPAGGRST